MTKAILATITALILMGSGVAYGETSTVEVPFDSHGQSCWYDELSVEYHCTWQGVVEKFTLEDLKEFKDILSESTYDREIQLLNEQALAEIAEEKAKLTPDEKTIQKLELRLEKGVINTPDAVLLQMLRDLDNCQQGLDNSSAIQQERSFVISNYQHLGVHNVQATGQLGELSMAIQECKAQYTLENQILTVAYKHFADANKAGNYDHYGAFEGISAIPFEKFTATSNQIDMSAICDNHQFSNQHKAQVGCEVLYDGKTAEQIKRENEIRFGTDGMIGYQSEALDKYFDFLDSYGNRQATDEDKKIQEEIAIPIANEWKNDHNFYQNHLED